MEKREYIQHWNYFCSLATKLNETKDYIYHGDIKSDNKKVKLIHYNCYSDIFKQIIILSASEFEIISKVICKLKNERCKNIVEISSAILKHFPKIIETQVITELWIDAPLENWHIYVENGKDKIEGLDWWKAYTSLKHNEDNSYKKATLENAVESLAALYIIHLYLMRELFGNLNLAYEYPNVYFKSKYTPYSINSGEGLLPDYGDKTPFENARDRFLK